MKFVRSENNQEKKQRGPGLHAKLVRSDNNEEMEHKGPGPCYRFSKNTLPPWTRRFVVKTFDSYWELCLKWVPKSNKYFWCRREEAVSVCL